jgi:hypothetical protein
VERGLYGRQRGRCRESASCVRDAGTCESYGLSDAVCGRYDPNQHVHPFPAPIFRAGEVGCTNARSLGATRPSVKDKRNVLVPSG